MIPGKLDGWDAKRRARDKEVKRFWKRRQRLPQTIFAVAMVTLIVTANVVTAFNVDWKDALLISLAASLFVSLFTLSHLVGRSDGWIEE